MFEKALKNKYRFYTPQGNLTTEDLFDLPLTSKSNRANLDDIARVINKQINDGTDISFVEEISANKTHLKNQLDIVKYIIKLKKDENQALQDAKNNAEMKQQLLEIIKDKENESLRNKTVEELREMAKSISSK